MSGKDPVPNAQAYEGVRATNPPNLIKSVRAPTTNDKKYAIGTMWINTATSVSYQLVAAPGVWTLLGSATGGDIQTLTGDAGGAILPALGNITLAGTSAQGISTSGAGSTITFTIADWTTAQKGVGVLSTNAQSIAGAGTTQAVTPASLAAKLGTQTNHGVLVGAGTAAAVTALAVGSTGQVLLGSTGADPAFGNLVTVNISNVTGATQALVAGTSYISNHASATVVFTLPASGSLGDRIEVIGNGPGGWQIAQNANQQIVMNSQSTTVGIGGSLNSTNKYNSVELYCVVAGASTVWNCKAASGSLTFV